MDYLSTMPIAPGDVISYIEMCQEEGASLQRGMNFRLRQGISVILMSVRRGAPYADKIEEGGRVLIYEGHDTPKRQGSRRDPKKVDQPIRTPSGRLTQNGQFFEAALCTKRAESAPERVRVYEKIRNGVWAFNGLFLLIDAWQEGANGRKVFKFKLLLSPEELTQPGREDFPIAHNRMIPSAVKLEVWKRDGGRCVRCGARENLHFDHVIPYSQGGSSLLSSNIQLLCAIHNLQKRDKIE